MDNPKAIVAGIYRRYAAGDIDGALSFFAPDVTHRACPNSAGRHFCGVYDGIEAVRRRIAEINRKIAFSRFEADWIIAEGDTVASRVSMAGTARATGAAFETTVTHTFRVAGGRVVDFEEFFDSSYVDRVIGLDAA